MFDTIVVGVDGREGGRDALALAGFLQRTFGSELIAVLAYPHDAFRTRASSVGFERALEEDAAKAIHDEVADADVRARAITVPDSSPARALHQIAENEQASLIVVGSDHRGKLGHVLPGDVTAGTLYAAPCPVAVAPRGLASATLSMGTIGVGYDDSPESGLALELARSLADAADARVEVIGVARTAMPIGPWMDATVIAKDEPREAREHLDAALAAAASSLGDRASASTEIGLPDVELAERSKELDLLVVGSRGYGPLKRLMLGSTSSKLVRSAACPVMVVPRPAHGTGADEVALAGTETA
jgi:nucleotide-binding universal stress UspA family protein